MKAGIKLRYKMSILTEHQFSYSPEAPYVVHGLANPNHFRVIVSVCYVLVSGFLFLSLDLVVWQLDPSLKGFLTIIVPSSIPFITSTCGLVCFLGKPSSRKKWLGKMFLWINTILAVTVLFGFFAYLAVAIG